MYLNKSGKQQSSIILSTRTIKKNAPKYKELKYADELVLDPLTGVTSALLSSSEIEENLSLNGGIEVKETEEKNLESLSLLWCGANISTSDENVRLQRELRQIIHFLKTFETPGEYKSYIQWHPTESIVLIISGSVDPQSTFEIRQFPQIIGVYIYCSSIVEYEQWSNNHHNITDIFTQSTALIEKLAVYQKQRNYRQQEELSISILEPNQSSLTSEFIRFQLIIEGLLKMNDMVQNAAFKQLITLCSQQYAGNNSALVMVKELAENFDPQRVIWWYTRESFVYRILSTALRRQDVDILVQCSLIICAMHQQLRMEQHFDEPTIYVYRGQLMDNHELDKLTRNEKRFISINTFFLTSRSRQVALEHATGSNSTEKKVPVLFELEVNTQLTGAKPYASIDHLSARRAGEKEVLFMLGSVFKIVNIERNKAEQIWIIKMQLVGEEERELKSMFESIRKKASDEQTGSLLLGAILYELGKYSEAKNYYKLQLSLLTKSDPIVPRCYSSLGRIASTMDDYPAALAYFSKALELDLKSKTPNEFQISNTYAKLGSLSKERADYDRALEYYSKALELKALGHEHDDTSDLYSSMGDIYQIKCDYDLALSNYSECLEIRKNSLPKDHSQIVSTLCNIAASYYMKQEYELAMNNYKEALSIRLSSIPTNIDTADLYHNIGVLYSVGFRNYTQALINYEKALKIYRCVLPLNHPQISSTRLGVYLARRLSHRN